MFHFHYMTGGVLIRINIFEQHDEIDITPAQLRLNSLFFFGFDYAKKVKYLINADLESHFLHP